MKAFLVSIVLIAGVLQAQAGGVSLECLEDSRSCANRVASVLTQAGCEPDLQSLDCGSINGVDVCRATTLNCINTYSHWVWGIDVRVCDEEFPNKVKLKQFKMGVTEGYGNSPGFICSK